MPGFDFSIGADTDAFERALKVDVPNAARAAGQKTANALGAALKAGLAGVAAAATAAGGLGAAVIKSASEFETLNMRLVTLMGSSSGAKARMAELADFAASTPFSLSGLTEAEATLRGFGADAEAALPKVADLAAAMGMDLAEASSAVGRAWAGGAGAADVLRERGVLAAMEMRTGIKATEMSLTDFRKELLVTLDDFEGGADTLSKTLPGMISTLRDEWDQFARQVADAGIYDASKQALVEVQGLLDDNRELVKQIAYNTGVWLKGSLLFAVDAVGELVNSFDYVKLAILAVRKQTGEWGADVRDVQASIAREWANFLPDFMADSAKAQAKLQEDAAYAARYNLQLLDAESEEIWARIDGRDSEVDDILSRIENADFGGAGIEKEQRQAPEGDDLTDAEIKELEERQKYINDLLDDFYADEEKAFRDSIDERAKAIEEGRELEIKIREEAAEEALRIAREQAREEQRIAEQSAGRMLSIVEDSARMRIDEDASAGEIIRQQSFSLMADLLRILAGKLAVEGTANLLAGNPMGIGMLAGAAAATVGAVALDSGAIPTAGGSETGGSSAGSQSNSTFVANGGGGESTDDGGLAEAARELRDAARDLKKAASRMGRSGGGSGLNAILTRERGVSGMRASFRGA